MISGTRRADLVAAGLLLVSIAWLAWVVFADGAHGPFGIWDATCHGRNPTGDGYAEGARRIEFGSLSLALGAVALSILLTTRRRNVLGCCFILLFALAPLVALGASNAVAGQCSG